MESSEMVALDRIAGSETQTRADLRPQAIEEYAERIRDGQPFDPAVVIKDGERLYLASGFHRRETYRRAGKSQMPCIVRKGSKFDAVKQGIRENLCHRGERLTCADRAHNVRLVIRMNSELDPKLSEREIAELCEVSPTTVGNHRKRLESGVQFGQSPTQVRQEGIERRCPAIQVPKGDQPFDLEATKPVFSAPAQKDYRDIKKFFDGAFADLGRLKAKVTEHRDFACGFANKILTKIDDIDSHLHDWKSNGDEE